VNFVIKVPSPLNYNVLRVKIMRINIEFLLVWLALLLHVWEVTVSILGSETRYFVRFFVVFFSPSRKMYLKTDNNCFLPHLPI